MAKKPCRLAGPAKRGIGKGKSNVQGKKTWMAAGKKDSVMKKTLGNVGIVSKRRNYRRPASEAMVLTAQKPRGERKNAGVPSSAIEG